MSNIDIRKFVDVNIVHHSTASLNTTRDTTVMFVDNADYANKNSVVSSKAAALALLGNITSGDEFDYITSYFGNGGQKLYIKSVTMTDPTPIVNAIKALQDEYIVIAFPAESAALFTAIQSLNVDTKFYGIKLKLAVGPYASLPSGVTSIPNVITQVTTKHEYGAIAAYLSKIDINRPNSIKDYDYTVVVADAQNPTDEDLDDYIDANTNIAIRLAGQTRNIGGNTSDGYDLVNEFTLIVLQQTVTQKVLNVIVQKVKGEIGVAAIHTAIAQELARYVNNGYLSTDKIWTDEDLTISYGTPAQTYVVISKDTPLLLGYQIKILPYSSLTAEDKAAHKAPPIYIVLADSYGIRKVTINGEVY